MDIRAFNRAAWNLQVQQGNPWTVPVTPEEIERARGGDWKLVLTPIKPVPASWYPSHPALDGCETLCLASGGGQQGPILAAAGAKVTVLDNSPAQLDRDRDVAEREGLEIRLIEGDMRDLSEIADGSFDFIVHPVSNIFVPEVLPVWREAFRVLRPGGTMIAGMTHPFLFLFDAELQKEGVFTLKYALPYSDLTSITPEQREKFYGKDEPIEFSHTLDELIGGQLEAGFQLTGFYEDYWGNSEPIDKHCPAFFATRARKP